MFSATQTRNVEDLARVSLKKSPLYVGVDDHRETSTVDGLEQVTVDSKELLEFQTIIFEYYSFSSVVEMSLV